MRMKSRRSRVVAKRKNREEGRKIKIPKNFSLSSIIFISKLVIRFHLLAIILSTNKEL